MDQLLERASNLRYNNSVITREINQMLRNIEEEEMEASLERVYKKQVLLRETSHLIAGIAIVSVVIAFLFLFFISRDISRSKYYRMQLEKAKQVAESLLRSREKLMLTISHDIRAPLSSIIGYIELFATPPSRRASAILSGEHERFLGSYPFLGERPVGFPAVGVRRDGGA